MALNLWPRWLYRPYHHVPLASHLPASYSHNSAAFLFMFVTTSKNSFLVTSSSPRRAHSCTQACFSKSGGSNVVSAGEGELVLDCSLINRVSSAREAAEVLEMIAAENEKNGGVLSCTDCCRIIGAAIERNNADLALSIFDAMRSNFDQGFEKEGTFLERWKWCRPDGTIFTTLILGLAASLRVSDALKVIAEICRVRVSPGEEVPFGKVLRCPTCAIAVSVVQPQHGVQIVSCSKCRYQYELVSGDIIDIESQEISMDFPAWKRGLKFLQLIKQTAPAAVHSVVIQTPSGLARTHKFATETTELPAQKGERVSITLAAPSSVSREVGPFKLSPRARKNYPEEPLSLTNHRDGRESLLLRAPSTNESISLISPSILLPLLAALATGDAASGIIDPSLPRILSVATLSSLALGATLSNLVLPQLSQLPVKSVDVIATKQKLLMQYDLLQTRISELKKASEDEIWMLARMYQLENKIFAIGDSSYRVRRGKVRRVREGLEKSLKGRIELIDSFARISSMIEIEVEMDTDVPAAEAASNVENTARQIEVMMELENLEERWREQAEANDEVERLLSSEPLLPPEQT